MELNCYLVSRATNPCMHERIIRRVSLYIHEHSKGDMSKPHKSNFTVMNEYVQFIEHNVKLTMEAF